MKQFKDKQGRDWTIEVTVGSARRVRDLTGFVLLSPDIMKTTTALAGDLVTMVDVTYALCKPQADERSVTDEQFGVMMRDVDLNAVLKSIMEETVDFFPQCREAMIRIFAATEKLSEKATANLAKLMEGDTLERSMEKMLSGSAGSWQVSSESNRNGSPSDSLT